MLHGLRNGELHIHPPTKGQHHHEERQPATGVVHLNATKCSPVDLGALPGGKREFEIDRPLRGSDAAHVIANNRQATAVPLLTHTLEDLHRAVRVGVQQPRDARFEGVKHTAARLGAAPLKLRTC